MPSKPFPEITPELIAVVFGSVGIDLAHGPDYTAYPDEKIEPNPEYTEEKKNVDASDISVRIVAD